MRRSVARRGRIRGTMAKQKSTPKRGSDVEGPRAGVVAADAGWAPSLANLLFGKPLATSEERAERVGSSAGIPIFGLDALSSAAYGPEAALTLLIPLGAAGIAYI